MKKVNEVVEFGSFAHTVGQPISMKTDTFKIHIILSFRCRKLKYAEKTLISLPLLYFISVIHFINPSWYGSHRESGNLFRKIGMSTLRMRNWM